MNDPRPFLRDLALGLTSRPWRLAPVGATLALGNLALASLLAISRGLEAQTRRFLQEFGPTTLLIVPASAVAGAPPALTRETARRLAANLPEAHVAAVRAVSVQSPDQKTATLIATDASWFTARRWSLELGRFWDELDVQRRERVAVITGDLARSWNAAAGSLLPLGDTRWRVVGVAAVGEGAAHAAIDTQPVGMGAGMIVVPWPAAESFMGTEAAPNAAVDAIYVRLPDENRFEIHRRRLLRLIGDPTVTFGPVTVIAPETLLRGVRRMQRAWGAGLGGMSVLAFLLGGVALSSLMTANVRERLTEIGLRLALGATRGDIVRLFVSEGVLVAFVAGLPGAAAALAVSPTLRRSALPFALDWPCVAMPLLGSAVMGWLASLAPALLAARTNPADALRAD